VLVDKRGAAGDEGGGRRRRRKRREKRTKLSGACAYNITVEGGEKKKVVAQGDKRETASLAKNLRVTFLFYGRRGMIFTGSYPFSRVSTLSELQGCRCR